MTLQEAYETMRTWLTREGARRATTHDGRTCMYLAPDDQKCAVGCLLRDDTLELYGSYIGGVCDLIEALLRDELHDPILDLIGQEALEHFHEFGDIAESTGDAGLAFLMFAQDIHDNASSWTSEGFDVGRLDALARDFDLKVVGT